MWSILTRPPYADVLVLAQKFGSNVVEKCVGRASSPALEAVMVEFMAEGALETLVADRAPC